MVLAVAELESSAAAQITPDDLAAAFVKLRTSLLSYLRKRVNDTALVEDLLQDIFVKAALALKEHRAPSNLTGWLYAAARTTVIDYYRSARPETIELDEDFPQAQEQNDEELHQELANCLRPMAQQLPAIYRETLLATDFDGKTMQTLANELGLSLSAIKSRASRARQMLKAQLLDCCEVEMANGLVCDYHRRSTKPACGGGCA